MKKMNTLLIAAMAFGVAGTAVASTTCHRILAKDHVSIALKGYTGAGKFFQSPKAVMESPLLPTGQWALNVKNGGVYPVDLSIQDPAICGKKIEYKVRLAYKGKILLNEDQSIPTNRWSPVYVSKPDHLQVLIKADHKAA
ncbi:MAG: hypothetical protein ACYCUY_06075 [Acidithiobacillus sp.]